METLKICVILVIGDVTLSTCLQAPRSGKRSFPFSLTVTGEPSEILGHNVCRSNVDSPENHSLFPEFARLLDFLRGLAAASGENVQTLNAVSELNMF